MFLTVFAASALAHILFTNPTKEVDLSDIKTSLRHLDDGLNQITNTMDRHHSEVVNQLASISDTTSFLKARMCLQDFNPKLLGTPKIGPDCHSVEAIMAAATEGFTLLMKVAVASDNGYPEAQHRFDETYGNYKWVSDHFGDELKAYQQYLERKKEAQLWNDQRNSKVHEILNRTEATWSTLIEYTRRLYNAADSWDNYKKSFLLKWKCKKIYNDITCIQTEMRKCLLECGRDIIYIPGYKEFIRMVKCTDIEHIFYFKPFWLVKESDSYLEKYEDLMRHPNTVSNSFQKLARLDTMQKIIPTPSLPFDNNWKAYNWIEPCNLSKTYPRTNIKEHRSDINKKLPLNTDRQIIATLAQSKRRRWTQSEIDYIRRGVVPLA